jgi:hypothetical protein
MIAMLSVIEEAKKKHLAEDWFGAGTCWWQISHLLSRLGRSNDSLFAARMAAAFDARGLAEDPNATRDLPMVA